METPPEQTPPVRKKRSFVWAYFVLMLVMGLLSYALSAGPVMKMRSRGIISPRNQLVNILYHPLGLLYRETPLHKPIGMYLHLWMPEWYDKNGDEPYRRK